MGVMESIVEIHTAPIRQVETRRDVVAVADLIELCFADTMDADGREYVRFLRRVAIHGTTFLGKSTPALTSSTLPIQGFVWEEDGKIVGNLTLIPFYKRDTRYYLIANVATHPHYRRRGIARLLTQYALDYIHEKKSAQAWLHVRSDNFGAQNLYRSLGFVDQFSRTTWQWNPDDWTDGPPMASGVEVTSRRRADWELQSTWLDNIYPPGVTWNLPLDTRSLKPSFWQEIRQAFTRSEISHFSARKQGRLIGVASCDSNHVMTDFLWLAVDAQNEDLAIRALLPAVQLWKDRSRSLSVNYPAGRAEEAFKSATFQPHLTLIWMKYES